MPTLVFLPGELHRGALRATVHGVAKELDTTECLTHTEGYIYSVCIWVMSEFNLFMCLFIFSKFLQ